MGTQVPHSTSLPDGLFSGLPSLVSDLQKLLDDRDTADVMFVVGREEVPMYAHRLILWARCKGYQRYKRDFWSKVTGMKGIMTIKQPKYKPEVFKNVLNYLYTGKMTLKDATVFEVLVIAQDMGVPDLQYSCEEHISSQLTVHNACFFLANALSTVPTLTTKGGATEIHPLVTRCLNFIEENAEDCLRTEGFLQLPKEPVIRLVSSDQLALEEEEVWRRVLAWAKYQAKVETAPQRWSPEEKARVCQHLSGVIEHVKLLLIDSKVFAEEVEPTGAVPMELSLERYRIAAVPTGLKNSRDRRLTPRVSHKLFKGTDILSRERLPLQRVLNQWYGDSKQEWRLLYKASRDGYTADAFHQNCDGFSPTIVLILGHKGNVCGGFSDVPWTSKAPAQGKYIASDRAFLFTLVNQQGVEPTRFNIVNKKFATSHHPNFGPIFGAGADLYIANNCHTGTECYSNLPHSYNGDHASCSILMGDYYFNVLDYEVFTLGDH
ncbi:uncharacterized protein LOC144927600 isoform X1 [Branchiostoma floridae x Branchiostoma belcheri]